MLNLLDEPIITVETLDGRRKASLPEVLALLAADGVEGFARVRPHQRAAWHVLLCQLAAIAIDGIHERPDGIPAGEWRRLLLARTPDWPNGEAWHLVQENFDVPAFLQPPIDGGASDVTVRGDDGKEYDPLAGFAIETAADDIDVVVTAKNHALKRGATFGRDDPEDWLYALTTLQTVSGYNGPGNYGVARAASGYSARPFVGLTPSLKPGPWFRRDVAVMLARKGEILARYPFLDANGIPFLWVLPWDGEAQVPPSRLSPWTIEVCRRIRLVRRGRGLAALRGLSRGTRVASGERGAALNGLLGCPWAPVEQREDGHRVLNITQGRIGYALAARILLHEDEIEPAPLQRAHEAIDGSGPSFFVIRAVTWGKGTTGWVERIVPLPPRTRFAFGSVSARETAALASRDMLSDIDALYADVLAKALYAYLEADGERLTAKASEEARRTLMPILREAVEPRIEQIFFSALWDRASDPQAGRERWIAALVEIARTAFEEFLGRVPRDPDTWHRDRAHAVLILENELTRLFGGHEKAQRPMSQKEQLIDQAVTNLIQRLCRPDASENELAELRAIDPDGRKPGAFWKIAVECLPMPLQDFDHESEKAWAGAVLAMALAAPENAKGTSLGRALAAIGFSTRQLGRLVDEDLSTEVIVAQARNAVEHLIENGAQVCLRDLARLILFTGDAHKAVCERITADYYAALARKS